MISVWWLLLIVPFAGFVGMMGMAWLAASSCADCRDAIRYREDLMESNKNATYLQAYEDGYRQGLKELQGVG